MVKVAAGPVRPRCIGGRGAPGGAGPVDEHAAVASEATVRKHLENIYSRLQVPSRTAAVTRAFPMAQAQYPGSMPN